LPVALNPENITASSNKILYFSAAESTSEEQIFLNQHHAPDFIDHYPFGLGSNNLFLGPGCCLDERI
jgi:hypothetical protein